ncbi:MAG: hypothetical protein HRT71_04180 [Flavobacteriales bacterium]|nr:hypothetical protein [Flavobacteriales bacterium]
MKALKKTGIGLGGFIALVFVVSLFFPTEIDVSRSVEINAPAPNVFSNVNSMEGWKK